MRSLAASFSVTGLLGHSSLRPAAHSHPPILPDTIVQWTRLITAGTMRYVDRPGCVRFK